MQSLQNLNRYVVFDTETTGLDPLKERIVEYGAIKIDNGKMLDSFVRIVNQPVEMPEVVARIHGITTERMRSEGIDPKEAAQKLCRYINGWPVIGMNNIAFDYGFLECELTRHNLPRVELTNWYDVGMWHKGICIGQNWDEKEPFFRYALRLRDIRARGVKYNLNHLAKTYGVDNLREEIGGLHGALVDIKLTHHVFEAMKKKYANVNNGIPESVQASGSELPI